MSKLKVGKHGSLTLHANSIKFRSEGGRLILELWQDSTFIASVDEYVNLTSGGYIYVNWYRRSV